MFTPTLLRRTALAVLLSFGTTIAPPIGAQPHLHLDHEYGHDPSHGTQGHADHEADDDYADLLDDMRDTAQEGADDADEHRSTREEARALRAQKSRLEALESAADRYFTDVEQDLRNKHLSPEILARHQAAVAEFATKRAEFKRKFRELEDADDRDDDVQRSQKVREVADFLERNQGPEPRREAGRLPFRGSDGEVRAPVEDEAGYQARAGLFGYKPVRVAGVLPNGVTLPQAVDLATPPTAADLAATADIQLSPAIQAQAAALGNNPVRIHNWVRNQIEFVPGYGSIQGAETTLQARRGNAFDTASLEIALLRAAGIPARYVYGTIQVPAERAMNWLGGVATPEAALSLLAQAGIPSKGQTSGGGIGAITLEHVWVEAWIDYVPSRGAVNRQGDTWVPLDPSFKLHTEQTGLDLAGGVSLNAQAVLDAGKQGATCAAESAQGVNTAHLQSAYDGYKTRLAAYLAQQGPDLTVGGVLGARTVTAKDYSILLGTLPYATVAVGARFATLPDSLRWSLRYAVYAGAVERAQNQPVVSFSTGLPALLGKRLTLSFAPATQADADTLAAYLPQAHVDGSPIQPSEFPVDLPAYLIHVKAELRADGQLVATGGDFVLGTALVGASGVYAPAAGAWQDSDHTVHAGEYHALAIDGQGVAVAELETLKSQLRPTQAALAAGQYGSLDRDAVTGGLLHQVALGYFALADANARLHQRAADVVDLRLPSHARAVAKVEPQYAYGIVTKARYPGVVLDIDRYQRAAVDKHNGALTAYTRQGMERASAYAHLVLEKMLVDGQHPGQGISAVKALAAANGQGQTVRLITPANAATLVPLLAIDATSKTEIANAAASGKTILAEDGNLRADDWTGSGYLLEDPATGRGDYRLSGGGHGALYPVGGMAWLALGDPAQSGAAVGHALTNGIQFDAQAAAVLGGLDSTRWAYFPSQTEVMNGLFLGHLDALQTAGACDRLTTTITAALSASSGIDSIGSSNQPPVIQSAPVTQATAGRPYGYPLQATDPDGDPLSYRIVAGPAGLAVDANGLATWTSPVEGAWSVTLRVDDGRAYVEQSYLLAVGQGPLSLDLALSVTPKVANPGDTITVGLVTNGGEAPLSLNLSVDGQTVPLDAAGQAQLTAAPGIHRLVATATDAQGTVTREDVYSTRDPADTTAPVAQIATPAADAEITAPTDIVGTATDANLAYYQLALRPAGGAADAWTEIGRGYAAVNNGKLGRLDPTTLANGLYDLALIVVDGNGQQTSTLVTVEITRDLKLGQFSVSFLDLDIEAAGIPIRVTRTYDTRHKGDKLDFGHGWSVDYQSVQIRKNMTLGLQWNVVQQQLSLCLRPAGQRKVSITLPDGKVERFTAANATECAFAQVPPVDIRFTALPGTTSTLEAINLPSLMAQGGQIYDMDTFGPWNPTDFKLTTEDGTIYYLKEGVGITQVKDPWGNTLTYGPDGIRHSNGQGVTFTRDAQGRITAVTDPTGKTIRYAYDANGDLTQATDRLNQASRYQYNREHGLTAYTDPSGVTVSRQIYDDQGRLIATIDADGRRTEINHDTASNTETVKNRRGYATTYTYDGQGNVTQVTDALGHTTRYAYDALGNETRVTDPLGNVTTRTYDTATGKQRSETDPLGHATAYGYDPIQKTQLKQVTDPKGNVTGFRYHGTAPSGIDAPLGRSTALDYDAKGNLRSLNVAGQATTYGYDAKGNRTTETDAAGTVTTYAYDGNNREISRSWQRTNAQGQTETITLTRQYDAEGRVIQETDALGGITRTSWNSAGKPTQVTDPQGRITAYAYDTQARLIKTTYPDGTTETTGYDANGNETAQTDRAGRTTRTDYDALDRPIKTTHPNGTFETTEYDAAGRIVATADANGQRTTNAYDAAGRLTETTDPQGGKTRYQYDANGNRTRTIDPLGRITAYTYDALNRLIQTTWPDGSTHTVVYRTDGRKQSETDPAGKTVSYGYDALGRLNQVTETLAGGQTLTTYRYDEAGNKTSQTDAEGRTTTWTYDQGNRVTQRALPNGEAETFQYDLAGHLTGHTDFQGRTTQYGYDSADRRTLTLYPDGGKQTVTYTADGRIASRTDATGTTTWTYDALGRPTRQTNPDGRTLAWSYDGNGNVIERSSPQGTTRYAYDGNDRLIRVTDPEGGITTYAWNAANQVTRIQVQNGTETRNEYDGNGRLIQTAHLKGTQVVDATRYTLAADGRRTRVETFDSLSSAAEANGQLALANPASTKDYGYDALNRLIGEAVSGRAQNYAIEYAYDAVGNRTRKTETRNGATTVSDYAYDGNDRLTTETTVRNTTTYAWDGNGNVAKKQTPTETTLYGWDAENRLIEVKRGVDEASAQTVASYVYDADGNRIRKVEKTPSGDKVTDYLIDATFPYAQVVEETTTQNGQTESTHYVWGAQLIKQTRGGQGTYYHADGLGSVKALTDGSGNLSDGYEYGVFGEVLAYSGTTANAYRYTGEYYDDAAQLQYNRARWYDPAVGRFTALDPHPGVLSRPGTLNKYGYAEGNPVSNVDPTGLMSLGEVNIAQSAQMIVSNAARQAGIQFAKGAGRKVFKELGDVVEGQVKRVIQQCLGVKPKGVRPNPARKVEIDVELDIKDALHLIEVKYQIPKRGSEAMGRLIEQIKEAAATGRDVVVFSGKELGGRAKANRERMLRELTGTDGVRVIGGFAEFVGWMASESMGCM